LKEIRGNFTQRDTKQAMVKRFEGDEIHRIPFGLREAYRLWWDYVQLARSEFGDTSVLKKYRDWGDLDMKFDDWFADNWETLFAVERGVKVVREQPNRIVLSIPLDEPIVHALKAVRAELSKRQAGPRARRKSRTSGAKFSIAAENLKYAPLRAYRRILAMNRRHGGKRGDVIDEYYAWAKQRNAKVRKWRKEGKPAGRRLELIDETGWDKATDRTRATIIVARYLKKGRKILQNTLAGQFPGEFT
jgi:hypothetical protein